MPSNFLLMLHVGIYLTWTRNCTGEQQRKDLLVGVCETWTFCIYFYYSASNNSSGLLTFAGGG
jgi:hypothetical protein